MRDRKNRDIEVGDEVVFSSSNWNRPILGTVMRITEKRVAVLFNELGWHSPQLCDPMHLLIVAPGSMEYARDRHQDLGPQP